MTNTDTHEETNNPNPNGGAMTEITHHATHPHRTQGEPMTNTDTHAETNNPNPNGGPMTEIAIHTTHAHTHDNPNPNGAPMTEPDEPIPDTLPMLTPHDAARAMLTGVACALGLDEVRVLVRIGERLKAGRKQYGPLHLPSDMRSFRGKEAREELEDTLVYLACAWLKAETHNLEVTR